jgi:hypothetical protein
MTVEHGFLLVAGKDEPPLKDDQELERKVKEKVTAASTYFWTQNF